MVQRMKIRGIRRNLTRLDPPNRFRYGRWLGQDLLFLCSHARRVLATLVMKLASLSAAQLEETWRGLTIALESRCSTYDPGGYPYVARQSR